MGLRRCEFWTIHPGAKVIMCSGVDDPDKIRQAISLGAQAYLVKPVQHLYLSAAIERCLGQDAGESRSSRGGRRDHANPTTLVPAQLTRAPAALIARCERYSPGIAGVGLRPVPKSGEIARRFQTPECW